MAQSVLGDDQCGEVIRRGRAPALQQKWLSRKKLLLHEGGVIHQTITPLICNTISYSFYTPNQKWKSPFLSSFVSIIYSGYRHNGIIQSTQSDLWMCSPPYCLDIYTGSCNVMSKPKVLKPLHLLTAFHAGVNWRRWPVKPALRSTGGDRRSLQRLIITAINSISRLEPKRKARGTNPKCKIQSITWRGK